MNIKTPHQVLDEIAQQHTRADINLTSGILARVRKENQKAMKTRYVLSAILGLAILIMVFMTNPGIAKAMQRLLGYIPGTGLVDNDTPLRILKDPVKITRGETSITALQGVVDGEHTVLTYQVENIPSSDFSTDPLKLNRCHHLPVLLLPDGAQLEGRVASGDSWVSGYSRRLEYPALPADVHSAEMVFSCLELTAETPALANVVVALDFIEAPADMTVYPMVDFPTPVPLPTVKVPVKPTQETQGGTLSMDDISLTLDKYIQTDEHIILFGTIGSQSTGNRIEPLDDSTIHLRDASGMEIPLVWEPSLTESQARTKPSELLWAYRTDTRYIPGKATLTVDSVWVGLSPNYQFSFDPGSNPQPGQTWVLNQSLQIGGKTILIQSAQLNADGDGLSFIIEKPDDIRGVNLMDFDHPLMGGGGSDELYGFTYQDGFPTGPIQLTLAGVSVNIAGPWEVSVELPPFADGKLPTLTTSACLTQATWQNAVEKPVALPTGLGGTLGFYNYLVSDQKFHVMTAKPNDKSWKVLAVGADITLSPDGSSAIYSGDASLQRIDLTSGLSTPFEGTGKNDRGAIWSPDGSKIAFTRGPESGLIGGPGPYNLMLANPDGSGQKALLANADANTAQSWMPDGQSLVYTVQTPEGASVRKIEIQSGKVTSLFMVNYHNASVAVSPDGTKVAYQEMLPGDHYAIFVANLDGSSSKLVVDTSPIVTTVPQWSPDGKWLVASVHDETFSPDIPVLALTQVDTCEIIPLTSLKGYVTTWLP